MARFTVAVPLKMEWRGLSFVGTAGTTHRLPDELYLEFIDDFVTNQSETRRMPGLAWISQDESTASGAHPDLAVHDALGLFTQVEFEAHTAAGDPHTAYALDADLANHEGAADPHTGYQKESEKGAANGYASLGADSLVPQDQLGTGVQDGTKFLRDDGTWQAGSSGAPTDADYLVGTAHAGLSAEIVVGTAPGGELGGTWASPTVDSVHSGSAHHAQSHELANGTGLGADHTISGAAAGEVLRASSATAAAFDQLQHTDLGGVSADQHHAQSHVLATGTALGADHTISGAAAGEVLRALSGTTAAFDQLGHGDLGSVTANQHHNQAHALTGADHTHSGGTATRFMRETGASTFAFEAIVISRGGTIEKSDGVTTGNRMVWRAPFACTVTNVRGHRKGGTGATINAQKNQASTHLASALSLTSADAWTDGGAVQNTAYAAGDDLEIMVVSVTGTVTELAIQVDFTRP